MSITKPQGYDEAQAYTGEVQTLPSGAYNCIIKQAEETTTKTGKRMLELRLDIADGEFKNHFSDKFAQQMQKAQNARWQGIYYQLMEGASTPYFKGLIAKIEESNKPFRFGWDNWKTLENKRIGGVFGREQYQATDGTLKFSTKCQYMVSIDKVSGITPPEDKLLKTNTPSYSSASSVSPSYSSAPKFEEISADDDLPF